MKVTTSLEGIEVVAGWRRWNRIVSVLSAMRRKPALLVDVDGVISLFGFAPNERPDGLWAQVDGFAHLLSPTAATHLLDLMSDFEPIWCTGWEDRANENLPGLLGLGPWPVIPIKRGGARAGTSVAGHWKLDAIDAFCGPDRPLAWIDDGLDDACDAWAAARPGATLLVRTQPAAGFTPAQADELREWARGLPADAA